MGEALPRLNPARQREVVRALRAFLRSSTRGPLIFCIVMCALVAVVLFSLWALIALESRHVNGPRSPLVFSPK